VTVFDGRGDGEATTCSVGGDALTVGARAIPYVDVDGV
jgi:hypothetical protein